MTLRPFASWQAYSYINPEIFVMAIAAVHGPVHVVGSSAVNVYSMPPATRLPPEPGATDR